MDSRQKHPWENEEFLIQQLDYIVDRVVTAGAIFSSIAYKKDDANFEKKWERMHKLQVDCDKANKGKEFPPRDFQGKFARILKLITDAYLEACKVPSNVDELPAGSSPRGGNSPRLTSSPRAAAGSPRGNESPRQTGSPRAAGSPRIGESPKLSESGRFQAPRLARSLSLSSKLRPASPLFRLAGNEEPTEIANFINGDFTKHHHARILGLLLSEIYRLMDANFLPSIREEDRSSVYYQSAIQLQFPVIEKEGEYDYIKNMYDRLRIPTGYTVPPEPTQTKSI